MLTTEDFYRSVREELERIDAAGLFKIGRVITSTQSSHVSTLDGSDVVNLCANNYLGLSSHRGIMQAAQAAQAALATRGFGLSSVRLICGTQDIHKELEVRLSRFLGTEDTILYGSAFDANGGLFEALLGADDAVISDELSRLSPRVEIPLPKSDWLGARSQYVVLGGQRGQAH